MTIKEMEQRTGLTRSHIRFYEKEKLIEPKRNEKNGYRVYSEEDAQRIEKIACLRTLGVSVEEILKVIQGECSLHHVLKAQEKKLDKELWEVKQAKLLCVQLLKEPSLTFQNLDPKRYILDEEDYHSQSAAVLKKDRVSVLCLWGSFMTWGVILVLSLMTAVLGYILIPGKMPVQWHDGAVSSSVDKLFIFAYPLGCLLIRAGLRPLIWRWLWLRFSVFCSDAITNAITNFLGFVLWSIEVFTILYVLGAVKYISAFFLLDGLIFVGLAVWTVLKLQKDPASHE